MRGSRHASSRAQARAGEPGAGSAPAVNARNTHRCSPCCATLSHAPSTSPPPASWTIPSNIPVATFGGKSLFGALNESIGANLAHFPTPPGVTDSFWCEGSGQGNEEWIGGWMDG